MASWRSKLILSLPYVTRAPKGSKCCRYVDPPLSVYFKDMKTRSNVKSTDLEHYRCKLPAVYKVKSLKRSYEQGRTLIMCYSHTVSFLSSMEEQPRFYKYWQKWKDNR